MYIYDTCTQTHAHGHGMISIYVYILVGIHEFCHYVYRFTWIPGQLFSYCTLGTIYPERETNLTESK